MKPLEGRNAIITGASQGLGKVIAEHFIRAGANVLLCARSKPDPSRQAARKENEIFFFIWKLGEPCESQDRTGSDSVTGNHGPLTRP